jgi:spore germination cell wall hydrolase CwlJ-like protein
VNPELRLLAACAAMILPQLCWGASDDQPITVRFTPLPLVIAKAEGPVSFTIPKYALSANERETVAACLVLEAANQGDFGMRSVMSVIRNRARGQPELFMQTVLRPKQFSALNQLTAGRETLARTLARARRDAMWPTALKIVDESVHDAWHDPTGGATHYTRSGERTPWTRSLAKTVTIGAHSFYR